MAKFAGLDVSVKETSVCVVDDAGTVLCELKVATEPDDIATLPGSIDSDYARVRIEAGPLSQWLVGALIEAGLPMVCREPRETAPISQEPIIGMMPMVSTVRP